MKYLKTYEDIVTFDLNDNEKKELISMAIERGNINILKSLLDNGYLPDYIDDIQPIITIQYHIENNYSLDMIKLFIDHGYNVNKIDINNGNTLLINSIYNFRKKILKNFLKCLKCS